LYAYYIHHSLAGQVGCYRGCKSGQAAGMFIVSPKNANTPWILSFFHVSHYSTPMLVLPHLPRVLKKHYIYVIVSIMVFILVILDK
jgi:hypothetical protein